MVLIFIYQIRAYEFTASNIFCHVFASLCKIGQFDLNIFYFIYMKRDLAEHRCYVIALGQFVSCQTVQKSLLVRPVA